MYSFIEMKLLLTAVSTTILFISAPAIPKSNPGSKTTVKWVVQKASTLSIQGTTNVSTFGCDIGDYCRPDTICYLTKGNGNDPVYVGGKLEIDITKFDCHNRILTKDLLKTLKADIYPKLIVHFLSFERPPQLSCSKDVMKGWVELELAGVARRFEICYSFIKTPCGSIQLNGIRCFSFADFSLSPPHKLGGIIKVRDSFDVDFKLLLTPAGQL